LIVALARQPLTYLRFGQLAAGEQLQSVEVRSARCQTS
jgi:hypothetical protein